MRLTAIALATASSVFATVPSGTVTVSTSVTGDQCVGATIAYNLGLNGIPVADPANNATGATQIGITVVSASVAAPVLTVVPLSTVTAGAGTVTILKSALSAAGEGITDAVVYVSVYYASSPNDRITVKSDKSFSVWDCSVFSAAVAGNPTITFPPAKTICAGVNSIPLTMNLSSVPTFDPKYGPTIFRAELDNVFGRQKDLFPPTRLDSLNNQTVITYNFTVGHELSGQTYNFKLFLNYFGQNTSTPMTVISSAPVAITDENTCFALANPSSTTTTTTAATATTAVSATSSKSGAVSMCAMTLSAVFAFVALVL
ncbi:hypothetical protein BC830DRAFT_1170952 [Chytriomyces sp. MP71]|nr:hypothetical protein BC830DRAFT_1170952 [Chytriomyces sp. MP71]